MIIDYYPFPTLTLFDGNNMIHSGQGNKEEGRNLSQTDVRWKFKVRTGPTISRTGGTGKNSKTTDRPPVQEQQVGGRSAYATISVVILIVYTHSPVTTQLRQPAVIQDYLTVFGLAALVGL